MSLPVKQRMIRLQSLPLIRQANRILDAIKENEDKLGEILLRLHDGEAWHEYKHDNFYDFCKVELSLDRRKADREMSAAIVREKLGLPAGYKVASSALEPLYALSAPDCAEVWEKAKETAGGASPTVDQVKRAVEDHRSQQASPEEEPEPEKVYVAEPVATTTTTVVGREPGDDLGDDEDEEPIEFSPEPPDIDDAGEEARFIASLPLIDKLEPKLRDRYVVGCLVWRRTERQRKAHVSGIREEFNRLKKQCRNIEPKYVEKILYALRTRGGPEWLGCKDCNLTGIRSVAGSNICCSSCDGHGYRL